MKTLAIALIAAVALVPAAVAQTAPATTASTAAKYNLDTPIQDIVADANAKAALDAAIPGVTDHPSYDMFKAMSLRAVAPYSDGKISPEALAAAEKALAQVK